MTDERWDRLEADSLKLKSAGVGQMTVNTATIRDLVAAARRGEVEEVLPAGFAADRPTGPRTEKGHALASSLRRRLPDAEIDYDAWIRAIEDAAEAWGKFRGMETALAASPAPEPPCAGCAVFHDLGHPDHVPGVAAPEPTGLDAASIEAELDMHNMLHDGRCDCGDHDDWPKTETFNHHVARALAARLRKDGAS